MITLDKLFKLIMTDPKKRLQAVKREITQNHFHLLETEGLLAEFLVCHCLQPIFYIGSELYILKMSCLVGNNCPTSSGTNGALLPLELCS